MPRRKNPKLTLDLSHLSEAECSAIISVLQKDFEIRALEKDRLHRKRKDVIEDDNAATLLTKRDEFNNKNCMRCYSNFIIIFNPRYTCFTCKFNVCKNCCQFVCDFRSHICNTCLKERDVMAASCDWFYDNVKQRFRHFGSAKVVKYLHSAKSDSSLEENAVTGLQKPKRYFPNSRLSSLRIRRSSGSDTIGSSGRVVTRPSSRPPLSNMFPQYGHTTEEQEVLQGLDGVATGSSTSEHEDMDDYKHDLENIGHHKVRSNSDHSSRHSKGHSPHLVTVDQNIVVFQQRMENVIEEMKEELKEKVKEEIPVQGTDKECDLLVKSYRDRVSEIVANFAQQLYDSYERNNVQMTKATEDMHQEVQNIIQHQVEKIVHYEVDSILEDNASMVSEDESTIGLRGGRIEHRLAQAVVQKVLDDHSIYLEELCIKSGMGNTSWTHLETQETEEEQILREQAMRVSRGPALPFFGTEVDPDLLVINSSRRSLVSSSEHSGDDLEYELPRESSPGHSAPSSNKSGSLFSSSWSGNVWFNTPRPAGGFSTQDSDSVQQVMRSLEQRNTVLVGGRDVSKLSDDLEQSDSSDSDHSRKVSTIKRAPQRNLQRDMGDGESSEQSTDFEDIYVANLDQDLPPGTIARAQRANRERKRKLKENHKRNHSGPPKIEKKSPSRDAPSVETLHSEQMKKKQSLGFTRVDQWTGSDENDPRFISKPREMSVKRGECAHVEVKVAGTAPIDVFWYRVSASQLAQITESRKYEHNSREDDGVHSLKIWDVDEDDSGEYLCVAVGINDGKVTQGFKILTAENPEPFKPPEFLSKFEDCEVKEGSDAKFRCKIRGYPQPRVIFMKEGSEVQEIPGRFEITKIGLRGFTLTLRSVTCEDDAEYSCVIRNCAGESRCEGQLIVLTEDEFNSKNKISQVDVLKRRMDGARNDTEKIADSTFTAAGQLASLHRELDSVDKNLDNIQTDIFRPTYALRSVTNQLVHTAVKAESSSAINKPPPSTPSSSTASLLIKKINASHLEKDKPDSHPVRVLRSSSLKKSVSLDQLHVSVAYFNPSSPLGTYPPVISPMTSKSHHDVTITPNQSETSIIECGLKKVDAKRYSRDFIIPGQQKMKVDADLRTRNTEMNKSISCENVESQREQVEEDVYGTAGGVFSLKERINALEERVRAASAPHESSDRHAEDWRLLEQEVARTVQDCSDTERQVSRIDHVVQNVFPTTHSDNKEVDASANTKISDIKQAEEELKTRDNNFKQLQSQFSKEPKGFHRVSSITMRSLSPAARQRAQSLRSETAVKKQIRGESSKHKSGDSMVNVAARRPPTPLSVDVEQTHSPSSIPSPGRLMSPAMSPSNHVISVKSPESSPPEFTKVTLKKTGRELREKRHSSNLVKSDK